MITSVACFEGYPAIHRNRRFRIYCQVSDSNNRYPALIYDYQSEFQHLTAKTADLRTLNLSGRDLREYDFTNKDLHGMVIADSDLRRAKFVGCNLTAILFQNCNLSEVIFEGCQMREARFTQCSLSQTRFSKTDLRGGELTHCDFYDSRWVRCDLSAVKILNEDLTQAFFTVAVCLMRFLKSLVPFTKTSSASVTYEAYSLTAITTSPAPRPLIATSAIPI